MDRFDVAIVGAGPGGYVAAIRAGQLGLKTALIEKRDALGGTCLNVGCIPSKALLESSEAYHHTKHGLDQHGISVEGVGLDLAKLLERKTAIVSELTGGIAMLMKKNKVKVFQGVGTLDGPGRLLVKNDDETTTVEARSIVLAQGSVPVELPFLPYDGESIVSSTEALSFTEVPKHLLVVGAGAIGLELGSVWMRLGATVTVVELLPNVAPFADKQLSKTLERSLAGQGMNFMLKSKVTRAEKTDEGLSVHIENDKGETQILACDKLLVAVGRRPNTAGLKEAGVELNERGFVAVDEHFRTNLDQVYAIGDLIPGPMLAHKAEEEGIACVERLAGKAGHMNYEVIPSVIYTHPELAVVGLSEDEAKKQGIPVKSGKFLYRANGRAKSMGEQDGLVKVVAHKETDRLLGVHIVGARASDLISEAVVAMEFQASAEDLARTIHAHPTLSEIVKEAAMAVDKNQIHG